MEQLATYLGSNPYPGRGIIIGKSPEGRNAVIAYFIMGRSENSRNRVFKRNNGGIRTEAYDPAKLKDPSLIIYSPVRIYEDTTIVTNGDQTDTIYEFLKAGKTFEEALRTRSFEPDAPNFTPRISGIVTVTGNSFSYKLSILKSDRGNEDQCLRFFYEYENPIKGEGHIIHTYEGDGDPLPSFTGEPRCVCIGNDIESFTRNIWLSLNEDNKVSLFVRYIDLLTGIADTRIVNKNGGKKK
ncbi:MAG TPA: inosine monophosphate cyclohydrolase [Clostridiales bacterium]|jgi:IMP cyclohydrolase|nr:inosine monophosphate cyclohydrolase [Clostridiales bacterium]